MAINVNQSIKKIKRIYDIQAGLFTTQVISSELTLGRFKYENSLIIDELSTLDTQAKLVLSEWGGQKPTFYNYDLSSSGVALTDEIRFFQGAPEIRVFNDVIYMPQYACLYTSDGLRIEDSCRFQGRGRRTLITDAPETIDVTLDRASLKRVSQKTIYAGVFNEHYGHFLLEDIARLWYAAKNQDLPILCHGLTARKTLKKTFLDTFFELVNLDRRRFITFKHPVLLNEVIIPYPSFSIRSEGFEVHKIIPENVANRVLQTCVQKTTNQPVYLSRSKLNRKFRQITNEDKLEILLREKGFLICYPEKLSLQEQIQLVNKHEVIIGSLGSAFHSILFDVSSTRNSVCFGLKEQFINSNYFIIDAIKSVNATYIAALEQDPDCTHTEPWLQTNILDLEVAVNGLKHIGLL